MTKRLFWFVMGALAGIFGLRYMKEKAKQATSQLTPAQLANDLYDGVVKVAKQGIEILRNLSQGETSSRSGTGKTNRE